MKWLIALVILLLFALLPVGICAEYNSEAHIWLLVGPLRLRLYPRKNKKADNLKSDKGTKPSGSFESYETKNKKSSGSLSDLFEIAQIVIDFLKDFKKKLLVKDVRLHIVLAGGDPCDLAVNYGRTWAVLGSLMPQLEQYFEIKKQDLRVSCDFTGSDSSVDAEIMLSARLCDVLSISIYHGVRILRKCIKNMNNSKAVQ